MKATEILENEHRIIETMLLCLEKMSDLTEKCKALDSNTARELIEFFRMFADRFHHAKEEAHLFPLLEAQGMPRDGGPTGVMLSEHDLGRDHVRRMAEAVASYDQGKAEALENFVRASRAYISLLREHIQKEDHCLFAMTNASLSPEDQASLLKAFRAVEAEQSHLGQTYEYYSQKARDLARRFHVKTKEVKPDVTSRCGDHGSSACCGS